MPSWKRSGLPDRRVLPKTKKLPPDFRPQLFCTKKGLKTALLVLLLMTILPKALLALVRGDLMTLPLTSTRHILSSWR